MAKRADIGVKAVAVHEDGCIETESNNLELALWHHDPGRLWSVVGARARWKLKCPARYPVATSANRNLAISFRSTARGMGKRWN